MHDIKFLTELIQKDKRVSELLPKYNICRACKAAAWIVKSGGIMCYCQELSLVTLSRALDPRAPHQTSDRDIILSCGRFEQEAQEDEDIED